MSDPRDKLQPLTTTVLGGHMEELNELELFYELEPYGEDWFDWENSDLVRECWQAPDDFE